jgi:gamma-glutamyl hercynylcysteine S-oxide synthase
VNTNIARFANLPLSAFLHIVLVCGNARAQQGTVFTLRIGDGLGLASYHEGSGQEKTLPAFLPLFSLEVNDTVLSSTVARSQRSGDSVDFSLPMGIRGVVHTDPSSARGWKTTILFRNSSEVKKKISNVVPLGSSPDHVFITATGPPSLSRSALFRPGLGPIGVILPDNAWEMGFSTVPAVDGQSVVSVARRLDSQNAEERRFSTILEPGGSVRYVLYADAHTGDWHEGLRLMFQERWLYDLEKFDNSLFERSDLQWIRKSYLLTLLFAWDRDYYNVREGKYHFEDFLKRRSGIFGNYDVFMIWPTWPRLGLDDRNQWDLYRDLPGGLGMIRSQVEAAHNSGTRYFIAYNPWDESTRPEDHLKGMKDILRATGSDGVVLDTRGESSRELQATADRVKPGIILYSEGMAVPKDMPGIVAGRVHDALYLPPPLNLNKFIKPEFAIFRVLQVADGILHREVAISLFNGYGVELNVMRAGRPDGIDQEYRYLGRAVRILRENSSAFLSPTWKPLLPALVDSVWVNQWPTPSKTVYTVYAVRPEGYTGPLFPVNKNTHEHYVSLWHHLEQTPVDIRGATYVPVVVDGFSRSWLGTRKEGSVDVVAALPHLLEVGRNDDSLSVRSSEDGSIVVWAGDPAYDARSFRMSPGNENVSLSSHFGTYDGKIVVQLSRENELLDERVVWVEKAMPRLVSGRERTRPSHIAPKGMMGIPAGNFSYAVTVADDANPIIPYPNQSGARSVSLGKYFVDEFPVTNEEFLRFIKSARYVPRDTANFLRHWHHGAIPEGLERHPVVWVSLEDARAYARWAGKRLPTAIEWQYAAQGTDGRAYPWGTTFDSSRCNSGSGHTMPVDAHPSGKSPFGVQDLVGNVWQLTQDEYDNGAYIFSMIRGGSFYNPTASIWYVKGGPWPVNRQQMLLRGGAGLDRNATVGFRCVRDAE